MANRNQSPQSFGDNKLGTIAGALRCRAAREPDRIAYRFVSYSFRGAVETETVTSRERDAWARAVAVTLREAGGGAPGDRVMLLLPTGLEYVASLFGCLYAGLIGVTAYPPGTTGSSRIESIARDADPRFVLVGQQAELPGADAQQVPTDVLSRVQWLISSRTIVDGREDSWATVPVGAETPAVLQYTSGSNSTPKGVVVRHENFLANARTAQSVYGLSAETVGVTWLPLYHDMGLMSGIVCPMVVGYPSILMSATSFVRDPGRWLATISTFQGKLTGGPTFSYQPPVDRARAAGPPQLDP